MLDQQLVQITVEAEATNIPRGLDVDIEGLELGQAVHASDLRLPEGVSLQVEPDTLILHVIEQRTAEPEEGDEEGTSEVPEAVAATAGAEQEQAG
jgi:large subunit ribosomal protein L25